LKPNFKGSQWCTVVGVVGDVRHWGVDVDIEPTAYYPYTQIPDALLPLLEANLSVAVRSSLREGALLPSIRAAVANIDKNVPVYEVKSMDSMVSDAGSLRRFDLSLLGAFSGLALALAAIGVYAVMAYSVSQRTQEIGIRIALGARSKDVLLLILSQGVRLAVAGVAAGVIAALLLRRVVANLLYGLTSADPLIFSIVPLMIVAVILLACYLPAYRATKVDPMVALRNE
jgi:putative ABC transport system permease protein